MLITLGAFGPILTLSNAARASLPSPCLLVVDSGVWTASLLGVTFGHVICGFSLFIYFSSRLCCPLRFQGSPQTHQWEYFLVFRNFSLFEDPLPRMDLHPYLFCLSFYLLYFFLHPFEDNGLLFWVPDVLCQHSEVVLWNLLSVQMFFWWICGGESGLPFLYLCQLRTASPLQNSDLGNPIDRGAWQAVLHRVAKNWTRLK